MCHFSFYADVTIPLYLIYLIMNSVVLEVLKYNISRVYVFSNKDIPVACKFQSQLLLDVAVFDLVINDFKA